MHTMGCARLSPFSAVAGSGFIQMVKFGATYGDSVDVDDLLPHPTTLSRNAQKKLKKKGL